MSIDNNINTLKKTPPNLNDFLTRDVNQEYDTLLKTIPDGLILLKDELIKYANSAFARLLGYEIIELSDHYYLNIVHPDDHHIIVDRKKRRANGEHLPNEFEINLIHKDGKQKIPVSVFLGLLRSQDENLHLVIIKDRSEKLSFESRYEREMQLQQYFMDYIPDSIYFKDLESRFIKANKATVEKMGLRFIDELIGKTDFDLFSDIHAAEAKKDEENIIKNKISIINKIEKETWLNGKITWVSTTKVPLLDENGNVYGTFGITRDITDLKQTELINEALLKISSAVTTLDNINVLYAFIHNAISELMKAENFYIALYNSEKDTVSFPYFVDQIDEPPGERKAGRGLTEYILRTGMPQLIDAERDLKLREAGETSLVGEPTQIWLGVPLKVEGKTFGAIVVQDYSDATTYTEEQKEILNYVSELVALAINKKTNEEKLIKFSEELKELNASKSKFFSIIAHDLKSPFHGLLGLTKMVVDDYDTMSEDELKTYLKVLCESTESTYKLIENLLEWSRLESGKMKYNPATQNMFMIVENTKNLIGQNARLKSITLKNRLTHQSTIWGDITMLQSLLQNLISNAIKFTPIGGVIEIMENEFEDKIEYAVSDSGVGIKEEDIEKLFRIDMSFSTKGTQQEKGTGLGLALCKEIVNIHGGEIKITSKIGSGTKVIFTLNKPKYF